MDFFLQAADIGLKALGLHHASRRHASKINLLRHPLDFTSLPAAFEGYTILHITDPHFDMLPGVIDALIAALPSESPDLVVLTGDYRRRLTGPFQQILAPMQQLRSALSARDGIYLTLGNHDTEQMVEPFRALGFSVLLNESVSITRGKDRISLTGLDDVHYYYTEEASRALEIAPSGFKIALVHSSEMQEVAAANGFSLYLCGHTHGGQICLPSGRPILTHIDLHHRYARGFWRAGSMIGYTSCGAGVIGLPLRIYCPGEITLFTLRKNGSL